MTITPLRLFNLETEQKIIREGFSLLEDPGVMVHNIEVLDLLEESGAVVDKKSQLARIPENLSRKALKSCPAEFSLYNLLGDPSIIFGSGQKYPKDSAG
jgi:trimethylamine:corrinoid methyltransferase-like protein